jgi:hypothetical protein
VEASPNGTITLKPNTGYVLFMRAEQYHMPVAKLLTGQDLPLSNLEMTLQNTYAAAQRKLQKQHGRGRRG